LHDLAPFGLEQDGIGVTPGSFVIEDRAAEYCAYASDSAEYYSNEPYLKVPVPQPDSKPGEFFQLDPNEAVVLIGLTPPLVKYFSHTPKITCLIRTLRLF
jgi:hypothetical protein